MTNPDKKLYQQQLEEVYEHIENELKTGTQITYAKINSIKLKITEIFLIIANLEGKNDQLEKDLKEEREKGNKHMISPMSYASAARKGVADKIRSTATAKPEGTTIIVTPKEGEDTRKIESKIKQILNPKEDRINIKSIRTTKRTVIIETEKKVDADKILSHGLLKEQIKMEKPRKRLPKIIIYDIPIKMGNQEIKDALFTQNFESEIEEKTFQESFNLIFKTGPRDKEVVHHVAEVTPKMRNLILQKSKLFLPFLAVTAKDYLVVARCMKCQDYGHIAKHCRKENKVCAHCSIENHDKKDCPNKDKPQKCIPCGSRNKKCLKLGKEWKDCETYIMMRQREIERTDYGE